MKKITLILIMVLSIGLSAQPWTVDIVQPEGGNISVYNDEQHNSPVVSGSTVLDGSTIYMKAVANPGKVVDGFLINGVSVFTNRYVVNSNINVSANFIDIKPWDGTAIPFEGIHGGNGSVEHPYHIDTPEHLAYLAKTVNEGSSYVGKYFDLTNELDMNGNTFKWIPIGLSPEKCFKGIFNGNGHTIGNLNIARSDSDLNAPNSIIYTGLFGYIGIGGVINKMGVIGNVSLTSRVLISGNYYVGGIAGCSEGSITNCFNRANINVICNDVCYVGGFSGWNKDTGSITYCYNAGIFTMSGSGANSANASGRIGRNTGGINYAYTLANCIIVDGNESNGNLTNPNFAKTDLYMKSGDMVALLNVPQPGILWYLSDASINDGYPILYNPNFTDMFLLTIIDVPNGTMVVLYDGGEKDGQQITTGTLIPRGTNIRLLGMPAEGYVTVGFKINGTEIAGFKHAVSGDTSIEPIFNIGGAPWSGSSLIWDSGKGTQDEPYLIKTADNLAYLTNQVTLGNTYMNTYFKVINTLDLNGGNQLWRPIGSAANAFDGIFEGMTIGHTIVNMNTNSANTCAGLFGRLGPNAEIRHVGIDNTSRITSPINNCNIGALAGRSQAKVIDNCYSNASITVNITTPDDVTAFVGGLVGNQLASSSITNSYNSGTVAVTVKNTESDAGSDRIFCSVGGIVGSSKGTTVSPCYVKYCHNIGTVTGRYTTDSNEGVADCYVGGIVGHSEGNQIMGSYNASKLNAYGSLGTFSSIYIGGIVGMMASSGDISTGKIDDCYNIGTISDTDENNTLNILGGLVGELASGEVTNSYNNGTIASNEGQLAGGICGMSGKGEYSNCYTLSSAAVSGSQNNGIVKDATYMRDVVFVHDLAGDNASNYNYWYVDFDNVNNGYPVIGNSDITSTTFTPIVYMAYDVQSGTSWDAESNWIYGVVPKQEEPTNKVWINGSLTLGGDGAILNWGEVKIEQNGILELGAESILNVKSVQNVSGTYSDLSIYNSADGVTGATNSSSVFKFGGVPPNALVKQKTITSGNATTGNDYHLISSPVGNINNADILKVFDNGYLDRYNEPKAVWERFGTYGEGWDPDNASTQHIEQGRGYAINFPTERNIEFRGRLFNGDMTFSTTSSPDCPYVNSRGLNLLGNPWTGAIDLSTMSTWSGFADNYEKSIWLWNKVGSQYKVYPTEFVENLAAIDGDGLVLPNSAVIPTCQGFWVKQKPNATNSSSFTIPYSAVSDRYTQGLYKHGETSHIKNLIKVTAQGERFSDNLMLVEVPNCSPNYDNGWDGEKWKGNIEAPQIYAIEGDRIYGIDSKSNIDETIIGFEAGSESSYTINAVSLNSATNYFLFDSKTGITHDFKNGGYAFSSNKNDVKDRFKIIFISAKVEEPHTDNSLRITSWDKTIYINRDINEDNDVLIYDTTGRIIKQLRINTNNMTINIENPGIYIVKVGELSRKVAIK